MNSISVRTTFPTGLSSSSSSLLLSSHSRLVSGASIQFTTKRWGSVRLLALEDLPHGRGYKGDVFTVRAGYARNFLIPNKKAVYATPQNFDKYGIIDPEFETEEQRIARILQESSMDKKAEQYLKDADKLKKYLRTKVLTLWRVVDPNSTDALHPGFVTAFNIRQKLSKQLKIDLQPHETIHIHPLNSLSHSELDNNTAQNMIDEFEPEGKCTVKITRLGDYLAKITLAGGHSIPLRLVVQKKLP